MLGKGMNPVFLNIRSLPLFKISYTPKSHCKLHKALEKKIEREEAERAEELEQLQR